ncbi:MAG: YceH family protein [Ilumatobacteraceae bacterium]
MLTGIEGRVLGCLLEKERTTPDLYPLTLNALVAACNQSTSREPVMHLEDHDVDAALVSLKAQGLLRFVHPTSGRGVTKYRQVATESWALEPDAAAVVAVLLLRGPQTSGELRTRSERLHEFSSAEEVEAVLHALAVDERVVLLERLPGQKEARWQQRFAEESEVTFVAGAAEAGDVRGGVADRVRDLEARVARLEAALADLLPADHGMAADQVLLD